MKDETLYIYKNDILVGYLNYQNKQISFNYDFKYSESGQAISLSIPLERNKTFKEKKILGFFQGLLPENPQLEIIGKNLRINPNNTFLMLKALGGDCLNGLTFVVDNSKQITPNLTPQYQLIENYEVLFSNLRQNPMLATKEDIRISLTGVQDKICISKGTEDKMYLPSNRTAASTHIFKMTHQVYKDLVHNENICLHLAHNIGLTSITSTLVRLTDKQNNDCKYSIEIKRYDREIIDGTVHKIHQEDFCQAMGIVSSKKYQQDGGPSLKDCFSLLKSEKDRIQLLRYVLFNFIIGNCDAHGKNFSLIWKKNNIVLAPMYDVICTLIYSDISKKMAMKIGNNYHHTAVKKEDWCHLIKKIGISKNVFNEVKNDLTTKIEGEINILSIPKESLETLGKIKQVIMSNIARLDFN